MFCTTLYVMHRSVTCVVVYLPVVRAARAHAHARRLLFGTQRGRKREREFIHPHRVLPTHAKAHKQIPHTNTP